MAEAGVDLYITAHREERLVKAAKDISETYGTSVTPVVADSSTEESRQALFAVCPDPEILSITIKPPAPNGNFLKLTPEKWRDSIETTLIGPIELMRHYIPGMKEICSPLSRFIVGQNIVIDGGQHHSLFWTVPEK